MNFLPFHFFYSTISFQLSHRYALLLKKNRLHKIRVGLERRERVRFLSTLGLKGR